MGQTRYLVHPVYSAGIWTHDLSNMSHHPHPLDQCAQPTYIVKNIVEQLVEWLPMVKISAVHIPAICWHSSFLIANLNLNLSF